MSSHNDHSPENLALATAVEAHRTGSTAKSGVDIDLAAYAATLAESGDPNSVARLSARRPWLDGVAALYSFNGSRWDTPADLIYCYPNQQPPGGWDGTVIYVDFTAPAAGDYLIVAAYHGINSIVHLRGPWGTIRKTMPAGLDDDLIAASWSGSGDIFFTLTFSESWVGQISAVQIFST